MPGRGSYPTGKWTHDRAHRILGKGDLQERYGDKAKSVAYAIATQQAHKMGKTPKKKGGYGTPEGKAEAMAKYDKPRSEYKKTAASQVAKLFTKARKGRRSIRVHNLLKKASLAGQDLRLPVMGGTKFPTQDSKSMSNSLLTKSQTSAEKGPTPSTRSLTPTGPSVPQVTGVSQGTMPKVGSAMKNDPLVRYLKKQAMCLETNHDSHTSGNPEVELASGSTAPTDDFEARALGQRQTLLADLFGNTSGISAKHHQKLLKKTSSILPGAAIGGAAGGALGALSADKGERLKGALLGAGAGAGVGGGLGLLRKSLKGLSAGRAPMKVNVQPGGASTPPKAPIKSLRHRALKAMTRRAIDRSNLPPQQRARALKELEVLFSGA